MNISCKSLCLIFVCLVSVSRVAAQAPDEKTESVMPSQITSLRTLPHDVIDDFKHLPSRESLWILGIGGALALSVHPADKDVNSYLSDDHGAYKAGKVIGNTGTLVGASVLTWGIGKMTGSNTTAHVAQDALRAIGESEVMLQTLKYTVRRERPDHSGGYAFPSGHSTDMFAVAAVIERHLSLKWSILAYSVSSYVAMSRLHDNVHYLSDVVFGAAIGTAAGRNITRHGSSNFSLMPIVVPRGAGLMVQMRIGQGHL
jgi:membrane-associated phospholipid phosphatase